jgi:CheY-like chemotaxis protein
VSGHSEGLGKGSEFTVSLPLIQTESDALTGRSPAPEIAHPPTGRKVLIVDDNLDAAESLAAVLSLKGHIVQTADGGEEALELAERDLPEIVFMDLGMPGMDGLTAARLLRTRPGGERIRIIALTGWGQESDRERTRAAGIDQHLVKPVDPDVLLEFLQ